MMSQLYKIPCNKCENSLDISVRDAGRQLRCPDCDAEFVAPRLREIKNLEPAGGALKIDKPKTKKQFGAQAWLFGGGLLTFVLAGAAGAGLLWYAGSITNNVDVDAKVQTLNQKVETAKPAELWDAWYAMQEHGPLPEWNENETQRYNKQGGYLKSISYGFLGLSGLGFLSIGASFLMKSD